MKIKFKDGTKKECKNLIEQKIFKGISQFAWVISLTLIGVENSEEIDKIVTDENISKLTIIECADEEEIETATIEGYRNINSEVIRYAEGKTFVELQFTKEVSQNAMH